MNRADSSRASFVWGAVGTLCLTGCEAKPPIVSNDAAPLAVHGEGGLLQKLVYAQEGCAAAVSFQPTAAHDLPFKLPAATQVGVFDGRALGCRDNQVVDVECNCEVASVRGCQAFFPLTPAQPISQDLVLVRGATESAILTAAAGKPATEGADGNCAACGEQNKLRQLRSICHPESPLMFDQAWVQELTGDRQALLVPASGSLYIYMIEEATADCAHDSAADVQLDLTNSRGTFGWKAVEHQLGVAYVRGEQSADLFRVGLSWNDGGLNVALEKDEREVTVQDFILDQIDEAGSAEQVDRLFVVERGNQRDLDDLNQQREERHSPLIEEVSGVSTLTLGFQTLDAPRLPLAMEQGYFVELEPPDVIGHRWVALVETAHPDVPAHGVMLIDLRKIFAEPTGAAISYEVELGFQSAKKVSESSLALLRETAPGSFDVTLLHHPTGKMVVLEHTPDESVGFEMPSVSHSELQLLARTPQDQHAPWRLVRFNELGERVAQFELPARARAVFEGWTPDGTTPDQLLILVVDHPTAGGMISIFDVATDGKPAPPTLVGQTLKGQGSVMRGFLKPQGYDP